MKRVARAQRAGFAVAGAARCVRRWARKTTTSANTSDDDDTSDDDAPKKTKKAKAKNADDDANDSSDDDAPKKSKKAKEAKEAKDSSDDDEKSKKANDDDAAVTNSGLKKQDLTGHDLGTTKRQTTFERDRFFVDKVDSDKTEKATLIQGSLTLSTFLYTETGGNYAGGMQGSDGATYSRYYGDLRLQTDFRHIAAAGGTRGSTHGFAPSIRPAPCRRLFLEIRRSRRRPSPRMCSRASTVRTSTTCASCG